jgi:hypothetical protein
MKLLTSCPSEADVLLSLLGDVRRPGDLPRHVEECASCRMKIAALQPIILAVRVAASTSPLEDGACLNELELAELTDGTLGEETQATRVAHVAACGRCRHELASLLELIREPDVSTEIRTLEKPLVASRPSWTKRIATLGPLLAAAVVLMLTRSTSEKSAAVHRAPTITSADPPAALAPLGDVKNGRVLRWAAVPGADRYRAMLFDATGRTLYEVQTPDTTVALPDSVVTERERSYLWKAEARTGFGRWVASELVEFRITSRSPE